MQAVSASVLTSWLRAAGEESRLRLLALCGEAAHSVSDLAHALRQSEPRVSRHLKILSEAGLIERLRQGQWVHYRLSSAAEPASFVRGLLGHLDRRDPLLLQDRARAQAAPGNPRHACGAESRLGRALAQLVRAGAAPPPETVLAVGVDHPELLETAASLSRRCTAIAHSRRAAQGARAHAARRGFSCRILQAAGAAGVSDTDLARAGAGFDVVLLDQPAGAEDTLVQQLQRARAALAPGGHVWLFERYDSLESSRGRVVEHPLARLRRLLREAGLECERLTPVEADGEHVLAALARATAAEPARALQAPGADR